MRRTMWAGVLLVGVLIVGGASASAQEKRRRAPGSGSSSTDLAITFTTERSNVTPGSNTNFWLRGASLDAAFNFYRGLGLATNVTAEHASQIAPGVNLDKLAFMAGPRYTFRTNTKHENRVFIEALFGGVHAYDNAFPGLTTATSTANSFSMQVGGGWDIAITKHFALRPIEADYVRTTLPNNGNDTQNHLRLAFGVSYHFSK